eukprot:g6119.t1
MEDPTGLTADPPESMVDGEEMSYVKQDIFAVRLGCFLHILHLAVNAGMESEFFMGPLGHGSWHEWEKPHLVGLLGMVWYNLSRSEAANTNWTQFKRLVHSKFGVLWLHKFVRPAETRWMVIWLGAAMLEGRWDEVVWLFAEWAPLKLLGTPLLQYWYRPMTQLKQPRIRLHAKFASELGEKVLFWAYHWLRGHGGYFIKRDGKAAERLPPAMRLAEVADFALEFPRRLEELRSKPQKYFPKLLEWGEANLGVGEFSHFMQNFRDGGTEGFFGACNERFQKWAERHQHLPLSVARLVCSSFYVGKWAGSPDQAWELAVGQEYARALLLALWEERYAGEPWVGWEEAHGFLEILQNDLRNATTAAQKDELTLGLYSKVVENDAFRLELEEYAASAQGKAEIGSDEIEDNPSCGTSSFKQIYEFKLLYEWGCHKIFFAPIQQQLVESLFSLYDKRTQPGDQREIDLVRLGQYRGKECRAIGRFDATSKEIRVAGQIAVSRAQAEKKAATERDPYASKHRKRAHDVKATLAKVKASHQGTAWVYASSASEGEEQSSEEEEDGSSSSSDGEEDDSSENESDV